MSNTIPADAAQHLNYQDGMFLTAQYMALEQNYFSTWFQLQNQYLFSPGVLNGMLVSRQNNALVVSQGVAFDVNGNFLILPDNNGNPVAVPPNPSNPFYVWAIYPDISLQKTPVVNAAAQLVAGSTAPANAVLLATVAVDSNYQITGVTDSRVPVTSLLPAKLGQQNAKGSTQPLQGTATISPTSLQGTVTVPTTNLQSAGDSTSLVVAYPGGQRFATVPTVVASVLGSQPYALAVQPETSQFTLTVFALQNNPAGVQNVDVSWIALLNS